MAREDVAAANAYISENWESFPPIQKLRYLKGHHPDKSIRDELENLFREHLDPLRIESELQAKMQMLAPWYEPGDERSEARFAAMVARKYGLTWWRDTKSILSLLGAMDDVWRSEFIEPHLIALDKINPPCGDPFSMGRMKRQWLKENSDLLDRQFETIRTKNPKRVRDAGGRGRGPWQFTKSLCFEYGLNCPELLEPSP